MPTAQGGLWGKVYGCLNGGLIGDAMGAPAEGKHFREIQAKFGEITDFEGVGTDDTAIKHILIEAILGEAEQGGHVTADEFARSFLGYGRQHYGKFWIPVRNMFHKIESGRALPVYAGMGNMQSSSSAMAIAPMGIVNACDPRRAAAETFDVAGLIHAGEAGFCRDAACAVAAGVAEAFRPQATVASCVDAAARYLHPTSAHEFTEAFSAVTGLADTAGDYASFREHFYERHLQDVIADSRETVPVAFALVRLSGGDFATGVKMAANFGRDADTIACMVGGILGALGGSAGIPVAWLKRVEGTKGVDYTTVATQLVDIVGRRRAEARLYLAELDGL